MVSISLKHPILVGFTFYTLFWTITYIVFIVFCIFWRDWPELYYEKYDLC